MQEEWKDIPEFENRYQASSLGRVRSVDRDQWCKTRDGVMHRRRYKGRILKSAVLPSGHLQVVLGKDGGSITVHICVMRAFYGAAPLGMEVLHLDHDPTNNRLGNLRYGTRSENLKMDYEAGSRTVPKNFIGARWRK